MTHNSKTYSLIYRSWLTHRVVEREFKLACDVSSHIYRYLGTPVDFYLFCIGSNFIQYCVEVELKHEPRKITVSVYVVSEDSCDERTI